MPEIVILAGLNGAGKTTLAARFVPRNAPFLNADEVARTLVPLLGKNVDIAAGRRWCSPRRPGAGSSAVSMA